MLVPSLFVVFLSLCGSALSATYTINDTFIGPSFLTGFIWETEADYTHGRVTFVDQATALATGLTWTNNDTLYMGADDTSYLSASGPGRNSIRIHSKHSYSDSVTVLDLRHMPTASGCATWPSFWTTVNGPGWPVGGEIDIIEYVNSEGPNLETLHTTAGCTQPAQRGMTGTSDSNNCDVGATDNQSCGVVNSSPLSAGAPFNAIGGGWYAMERSSSVVSIWFWPRNSTSVPSAVVYGAESVDTGTWGTPDATWVNEWCDLEYYLAPHDIIFDLTLCGDWAGNAYPSSCPGTCIDHVNNDPASFSEAYWNIASLRVYD